MNKRFATAWSALGFLSVVALPGNGAAAEPVSSGPLSLEQAISEGLGGSPALKAFVDAEEQARWEKLGGFSLLMPHLEFQAKHDFSDQYETVPESLGGATVVVPVVSPQTSFGVQATWTVFDGLANIHRYAATQARYQAAQQETQRKRFETSKRIELAFFSALAAQRFEEVAEENLKTVRENRAQVVARVAAGVATDYDRLRVEVRLSDATNELERTRDDVVIQRKKLAQAMGLPGDSRKLAGALPNPALAAKVAELETVDPTRRQDFEAIRLREQAASHESAASTGALVPSIGLAAHIEHYDNTGYPGEAYGGFRDAWSAGVFAKWSILDGGASVARMGAEHAKAARAEHVYQETLLSLPSDFELWKRRYTYSANRFGAKQDDVRRSEESLRISNISFQQGRRTITDVLEAETDLFRARADVVQSQLDAEEARIELELTLGKEL
jgi:outer membrane protein TolC